jgi:uncharacterized membrane protein
LVWSLVGSDLMALPLASLLAGRSPGYGAATAPKILFVQAIPAAVALIVTLAM